VAIALIVSAGTETSLAGNYRSSTGVNYAALAGVEEIRARLAPKNPSSFVNTDPSFLPAPGTPLAVCSVYYVLNPLGSETVTPWVTGSTYADNEFGPEFLSSGCSMPASPHTANSIWKRNPLNTLPFPGPLYKWVRINAVSEQSINVDVSPFDGTKSPTTPVYYDGTSLNDSNNGNQVIEITALAVLPNGSQKLVQYLTAPVPITLPPFLAALTLSGSAGSGAAFSSPDTNTAYAVKGDDQDCSGSPTGSEFVSIGVFTNADITAVKTGGNGGNGIKPPSVRPTNYTGVSPSPDVENISGSFPPGLLNPSNLDAIVPVISQNADVILTPPPPFPPAPPFLGTTDAPTLHASAIAAGMSSSNPVTVVINGNLDISNWGAGGFGYAPGYGLLVVTGKFTYDPDTNWNGIILVIGQGVVNNTQHGGFNSINGALFVAKTRGLGPNFILLASLGGASVKFDDPMQGNGIRYSTCWIQKATPAAKYNILSFHEIAQ
jgi:hypothetical protein